MEKSALIAGLAETWLSALKQHDGKKAMPRWSSERLERREALVGMIRVGLLTAHHETLQEFLGHSLATAKKYDLREDHLAALQELQPLLEGHADLSPHLSALVPWLTEDVVRSLLQLSLLRPQRSSSRRVSSAERQRAIASFMSSLGIEAIYQSERKINDKFFNFSPSMAVR